MARQIDTIANRITLEGGAEILKFLDSLGTEGQAAANKLRDAFSKSGFDKGVETKVNNIRKSFRGLSGEARAAAASVSPLRDALVGLQAFSGSLLGGLGIGALGAGSLGFAGLGAALAALTVKFGENASALQNQADAFGINTDLLQKYQREMILANRPVEGLDRILTSLGDKLADNDKQLKTNTKTVEVFGGKTVNVVKGIRDIDAETGKLKQSSDFTVPTNELGKLGEKTVTVTRGAADLNEQLKKRSDLLDGLKPKQLEDGTAIDELSKRIQNYKNQVQALVDAGFDKKSAKGFANFLNEHFKALQADEAQINKTGKALTDFQEAQRTGIVPIFKQEDIDRGVATNTELDKVRINLSNIFQNLTNSDAVSTFLRNFNFGLVEINAGLPTVGRGLEQIGNLADIISGRAKFGAGDNLISGLAKDATAAQPALDATKDSLTGIRAVLMGVGVDTAGPGAGLSAGTGTGFLPGIATDAEAAKTVTDSLSQSLQSVPFDEFELQAQQAAENASTALSQTGQNVHIEIPTGVFDGLTSQAQIAATDAAGKFPPPFKSAWDQILSDARAAFAQLNQIIAQTLAAARQAAQAASSIDPSFGGGRRGSDGSFSPTPFAVGGPVWGPGTTTSDSILARLSRGEFVINAKAVDHYGPRIFDLLNSRRLPLDIFERLRSFSTGGLIAALERSYSVPRFANGGQVVAPRSSGGQPLVLQLGPGGARISTGLTVLSDERRAEVKGRQLSAGKKPTYWGL